MMKMIEIKHNNLSETTVRQLNLSVKKSMCVISNNRGFSLLEVIVALAVLAVGIAGVLRVYSSSINSVKEAESYSVAAILADRVAFTLNSDTELVSGEESGSFDDNPNYRWIANIGSADDNNMMKTVITVLWGINGRPRSYKMIAYLRPTFGNSEGTGD